MTAPDVIAAGVARFLAAEVEPSVLLPGASATETGRAVHVGAIGTTAARAVRGELLAQAISARGFTLASATPFDDPAMLLDDPAWGLAVVLSPWKQAIGEHCDALAPSAQATGVVDTVVRTGSGRIGFNTNTWAAMSAMELVEGGGSPASLVVLGAGASSRSVALAAGRAWPQCRLIVAARSREAAEQLAAGFGAMVLDDADLDALGAAPLVVNTTTWGETEASEAEPFPIDLDRLLVPGARYFDLNNRIGALAHRALAAGCAVVTGGLMQRITNACRAALLQYAA